MMSSWWWRFHLGWLQLSTLWEQKLLRPERWALQEAPAEDLLYRPGSSKGIGSRQFIAAFPAERSPQKVVIVRESYPKMADTFRLRIYKKLPNRIEVIILYSVPVDMLQFHIPNAGIIYHLSNKKPRFLGYIGDCPTHSYGDCNKPL